MLTTVCWDLGLIYQEDWLTPGSPDGCTIGAWAVKCSLLQFPLDFSGFAFFPTLMQATDKQHYTHY